MRVQDNHIGTVAIVEITRDEAMLLSDAIRNIRAAGGDAHRIKLNTIVTRLTDFVVGKQETLFDINRVTEAIIEHRCSFMADMCQQHKLRKMTNSEIRAIDHVLTIVMTAHPRQTADDKAFVTRLYKFHQSKIVGKLRSFKESFSLNLDPSEACDMNRCLNIYYNLPSTAADPYQTLAASNLMRLGQSVALLY